MINDIMKFIIICKCFKIKDCRKYAHENTQKMSRSNYFPPADQSFHQRIIVAPVSPGRSPQGSGGSG